MYKTSGAAASTWLLVRLHVPLADAQVSCSAARGRLTEKDRIKIIESFRLGDVVKALVVRRLPPSWSLRAWSQRTDSQLARRT